MAVRLREWLHRHAKIFFILPAVVWLLAFTIFPLLYSLYLSFHGSRFLRPTDFIGFENYHYVLTDYRFWQSFRVTLLFVLVGTAVTVTLGLLLALLFNRPVKGLRFLRSLATMPLFAAPVAVGYLSMILFYEEGGPFNEILKAMGMSKITWLSDPFWAKIVVLYADVWQWTPFAFLVLLAALQSVPLELYESAALDTRSNWQVFRHITLPIIQPALVTVILLRMVEAFKMFDIPFSLTNGGPGIATRTITFNVYITGIRQQNLGEATAMAFLLLIMVLLVSIVHSPLPPPVRVRWGVGAAADVEGEPSLHWVGHDPGRDLAHSSLLLGDHHLLKTACRRVQAFSHPVPPIRPDPGQLAQRIGAAEDGDLIGPFHQLLSSLSSTAVIALAIGTLAGYALARFKYQRWKNKDIALWIFPRGSCPRLRRSSPSSSCSSSSASSTPGWR